MDSIKLMGFMDSMGLHGNQGHPRSYILLQYTPAIASSLGRHCIVMGSSLPRHCLVIASSLPRHCLVIAS